LNTSETQWRRFTAGPGSSIYYATRFLDGASRRHLLALYAIAGEIVGVADDCSDIGVARSKLGWWAEELGRLSEGVPRHPLTAALKQLPVDGLLPLCTAVDEYIEQKGFVDETRLESYCAAYGGVQETAARILGVREPDQLDYAASLGAILAHAMLLADSGRMLHRGYSPLPRSALVSSGLQNLTLTAIKESAAIHASLRGRVDGCRAGIRSMQRPPGGPAGHKLHPLVIQARITAARLEEIRRDGYRVLERSVDITPLHRLWLSLRTYYGSRLASK